MPGGRVFLFCLGLTAAVLAQTPTRTETEPSRRDLEFLAKVSAVRPFLEDCPDLRTEPQSIGKFFTPEIYARLRGNEFYGYRHDEGFCWDGRAAGLQPAAAVPAARKYRAALEEVLLDLLRERGVQPDPGAAAQIGVCLVGVAESAAGEGLPGVCLEVFFTNRRTGRSLFWRFGLGSRDGPAAARVDAASAVGGLLQTKATQTGKEH